MGNCQRRQAPNSLKKALIPEAPSVRAPPGLEKPTLRADAQPYVPKSRQPPPSVDDDDDKEPWEMFLDKKKADLRHKQVNNLRQGRDGMYTSQYRDLLGTTKGRNLAPPARDKPRDFDILKSWRSAAPVRSPKEEIEPGLKKRKATPLKKQILAQRGDTPASNPLWDRFADHLQKFKDDAQVTPQATQETKDDIAGPSASSIVPYGLAERHYMSDSEDSKKTNKHIEYTHGPVREYVDMCLTPELESSVVALLFRLRQLKMQDLGLGHKSRRYAVGFREVSRLLAQRSVTALLIAPDVEPTGGALEDKVLSLKSACERDGVPVIFALSRRQLGAAIQKNVTISVLAIHELRGAQDLFETVLKEASFARAAEKSPALTQFQ
jgi:ribosomal protein L7Ae-like RNA K-turn-binding protein